MTPEARQSIADRMIESIEHRRWWVFRQLGRDDSEDVIQDAICKALEALQRGVEIESPDKYVTGILHHLICAVIGRRQFARHMLVDAEVLRFRRGYVQDTQQKLEQGQVRDRALEQVRPEQREILERFYLQDESEAQIREAMDLTATQFRLNKSRAKADFEQRARRILTFRPVPRIEIPETKAA